MTLIQRLTALATAMGQALRERGLPLGGNAGDVLIRQPGEPLTTTWGPVQVTSVGDLNNLITTAKSNVVSAINEVRSDLNALSVSEVRATDYVGVDYLTADRPVNSAGRAMSGPIIDATNASYRFSTITVPLRNVQAGDVLQLTIQEVPISNAGYATSTAPIRYLRYVNLNPGDVSADFTGPFDVPAGKSYAIMVGIVGAFNNGGDGPKLDRFYGDGSSYSNFDGRVVRAASRAIADAGDSIDANASGGRRIILMTGTAGLKTLVGPIAPRDFPTAGSITGLAKGDTALIVDSAGERLAMRRLDGSVKYGTYLDLSQPTVGIQAAVRTKRMSAQTFNTAASASGVWDWAYAGNDTRSTVSASVVPTGGAVSEAQVTSNAGAVAGMGGRGLMFLERVTRVGGVTGRIRLRFYQQTTSATGDWSRAPGVAFTGSDNSRPLLEYILPADQNEVYPGLFAAAYTGTTGRIGVTAEALDSATTGSTVTLGYRLMG